MSQDSSNPPFSKRFLYLVVFAIVTVVLLSASLWVLNLVRKTVAVQATEEAPSTTFINYNVVPGASVAPESLVAMAVYIGANPQPKNAQVLTGTTTAEIATFMVSQVATGLNVDCTYCHNTQDFSLDSWDGGTDAMARKATAREHLKMVGDLNKNWLPILQTITVDKRPYGAQVVCSTCHLGEAKPVAWATNLNALPDSFRLPLDDLNQLIVTGRTDISLDTVQVNQYTMYHMSNSLGVGCTHCHNSRYFPSYEQPNKYFALTMLQMAQHIRNTYKPVMNNQDPSCVLCHRNQILPPGAAQPSVVLPAALSGQPAVAVSQK